MWQEKVDTKSKSTSLSPSLALPSLSTFARQTCCVVFIVNLTQPKITLDESLNEEWSRSGQVDLSVCHWEIALIVNWCRKMQPMWASPFPRERVLGCLRQGKAGWEPAGSLHAFVSLSPLDCGCNVTSCLASLPWLHLRKGLWPGITCQSTFSCPMLLFGRVFCHDHR